MTEKIQVSKEVYSALIGGAFAQQNSSSSSAFEQGLLLLEWIDENIEIED